MTSTLERPLSLSPASRWESPAVPVLIRVPSVAGVARGPVIRLAPPRRRRLRREVRLVALTLLLAVPLSAGLVFALVGRDARPLTVASASTLMASMEDADSGVEDRAEPLSSIQLGPIVTLTTPGRDNEVPVTLPGYLLPAVSDSSEDSRDGGH